MKNYTIMKTFLFKNLLIASILFFIPACSEEDYDTDRVVSQEVKELSAKWNVTNYYSSGTYDFFEFNEDGTYLVVRNYETSENPKIRFGNYTRKGNTVTLFNFGTMIITEINDYNLNFRLRLADDGSETTITATRQSEMNSSKRTDLFCRTWKVMSVSIDGVNTNQDVEMILLFSKAGTYFAYAQNNRYNELMKIDIFQWNWKDSNEKEFTYSSHGYRFEDLILELTKDKLVFEDSGFKISCRPVNSFGTLFRASEFSTDKQVTKKIAFSREPSSFFEFISNLVLQNQE